MLNLEYPNFEKKSLDELELKLSEPIKNKYSREKKGVFYKSRKDFINHLTN